MVMRDHKDLVIQRSWVLVIVIIRHTGRTFVPQQGRIIECSVNRASREDKQWVTKYMLEQVFLGTASPGSRLYSSWCVWPWNSFCL